MRRSLGSGARAHEVYAIRDLTERRRVEEELRRRNLVLQQWEDELGAQNRRFEATLANMPLGLCMIDPEFRIVICNQRYVEMYDLPAHLVRPGASIAGIDWALTAARREQLIGQVRRAAVQDAVAKAQAYADAVGAGTVRVVAIADAGMLGEGLHPTQAPSAKFARAVAADSGGPVEFTPEDIATAAEVDVRCLAG